MQKILKDHSINVDFIAPKPERVKYNFITKELFDHETDFMPIKGMTINFIYEEFHPDHKQEITDITNNFLNDFFDRKLNVDTYYINKELIEPDGNILPREKLINRFHSLYEATVEFENNLFKIDNIDFKLKEVEGNGTSGMGFSEGEINYDMIFRDGERKNTHGPFKLYFAKEWNCWSIYFFYLAGYNLHPKKPNA